MSTAPVPLEGRASDGSDSSFGTNVSASPWPCPRRSTTPHDVRGRTLPGSGFERDAQHGQVSGAPTPIWSSSSCLKARRFPATLCVVPMVQILDSTGPQGGLGGGGAAEARRAVCRAGSRGSADGARMCTGGVAVKALGAEGSSGTD